MMEREQQQADLLESYWAALAQNPAAAPPDALDPELAQMAQRLARGLHTPEPEAAFTEHLRLQLGLSPAAKPAPAGEDGTRLRWRGLPGFLGWLGFGAPARLSAAWLVLALALALSAVAALVVSRMQPLPGGPTLVAGDIEVRPTGDEVPTSSAILVSFKTPVDRGTVEQGFRVAPETPGALSWRGTTLVFRPEWPGLARGTTYTVRVPLPERVRATVDGEEVTFSFTTAGKLAVQSVVPVPDGAEVAAESVVMVQFNRPVAPLTTLRNVTTANILRFDPPVEGTGRWLTSTLYRFQPAQGFRPSTAYRVTVSGTVSDTLGGALGEDHTWSFRTISPGVADTFPRDNTQYVGPNAAVKAIFNQPVDREGAQAAFSLAPDGGQALPGSFSWENARTLVFRPATPLERDRRYTATVAAGGPANIAKDVSWGFRTAPLPRVVRTMPQDGDQRANQGSVQISFSTPMDRESVEATLQVEPKPAQALRPGWSDSDTQLYLWFPQQPSSPYTVRIGPGARDRYGASLPPVTISYVTAPRPPLASLLRTFPMGTFSAYTTPEVLVQAVNQPQVGLNLHRLSRAQFLERVANPGPGVPAGAALVRAWQQETTLASENVSSLTRITLTGEGGSALEPGYYLLSLTEGAGQDGMRFTVSRTHLMVKQTEAEVLVWATDLASGRPVADLPLTLYQNRPKEDPREIATGRTDAQGVATVRLSLSGDQQEKGRYVGQVAVVAERDGDVAYGGSNLSNGISPWSFGLSYTSGSSPWSGFLYTDRPIYRPGQPVYYKGIIRQDDDARYSLPTDGPALVLEVRDPQGRVVSTQEVSLNEYGAFDGSLELAAEAPLGRYNLMVLQKLPGDARMSLAADGFTVAAYRRPEYEVTVQPAQREVINGQAIQVETDASYYFGAPVADAPLRWRSTSRDYFFQHPDAPGYIFSDYDRSEPRPQGQARPAGTGRTDSAGQVGFSLPTNIDRDPVSQVYTIEATVTDANNQEVSARAEVIVHRGAYYIGLKPDRYVGSAGREQAVQVLTVDTEQQIAPGVALTAQVYRRTWISVKQQDPDGEVRWRSQPQDTLVATVPVTTDGEGRATVRFTPERGGAYRVVAEGRDRLGNTVRSATMVWIAGSEYVPWAMETNDRLKLVADRVEYRVGDTAQVLVPAPFAGGTALITLERGRILSHEVRALSGNSSILEIPITEDHIPNLYVSVALFKGQTAEGPAAMKLGYVELPVATAAKRLEVGLAADQTRLGPGDTVTYTVTTKDHTGTPVPAEVSLAVVDAAVLALTDEATPDPLAHFYRRRPLGVLTGDTYAVSLDRLAELAGGVEREGGGKGGSGGGANGDRARSLFPDTAYWNATVRTDAQGRAQVSVPLPDNLTTWRLIAVAATQDT
ncbi:MAG: Ig-like domain-containing protein, partial [Chloroflexi bacterium]|nr:Ig-like domain-containing protein [Chloroflexota bacterium]